MTILNIDSFNMLSIAQKVRGTEFKTTRIHVPNVVCKMALQEFPSLATGGSKTAAVVNGVASAER